MRQLMLPMSSYSPDSSRFAFAGGSLEMPLSQLPTRQRPSSRGSMGRSRIGYSPLARLTRLFVEWTGVVLVVAVPYCIGTFY
jgi:hypothetical protein